MTDANTHGKHHGDLIELKRLFKQTVTAVMTPIWAVIQEAEAEGHRLAQEEAAFAATRERGEIPDPVEVARVRAAQAAILQRLERVQAHIDSIGRHVEAIEKTAEGAAFTALVRQFKEQFGTTEGL